MNHKFTPDGKKVVIIGALNSKETIVQEIFVTDGTEFPAGEHFIVKTLLEAPAETYQAKQIKKEEEKLTQLKSESEKLRKEISNFRFASAAAASKIKWIQGIKDSELERVFEHIKSVICGEYTHILFDDYGDLRIEEWDAEQFNRSERSGENRRFDGIRLVSLFGVWNNRLELDWRVNTYSDGSGSNKSFTPCKSFNEAVEKAKEIIYSKDYLSDNNYGFCLKYEVEIDEVKNQARIAGKTEAIKKNISEKRKQLVELEAKLNNMVG